MKKKSVSVVIPNYNGKKLLEENLPHVFYALIKSQIDYEVIVVDDASTDDSIQFLEKKYPLIIVLQNQCNMGFSPTVNKGIKQCTKDLVLVLNSDVILMEDYFEPLFKYFDKADTFGVTGRVIGLNDDGIQESAKYPNQLWFGKIQPYNFYINNPAGFDVPSLYLCGANALMDRLKLQKLNGHLEVYAPFYVEDADLGIRAWLSGWRCYYEHQAVCRHPASVTIKRFNHKNRIWIVTNRNKFILHSLYLGRFSLLLWYMRAILILCFHFVTLKWKYHRSFLAFLKRRNEAKKSTVYVNNQLSIEHVMREIRDELDQFSIVRVK